MEPVHGEAEESSGTGAREGHGTLRFRHFIEEPGMESRGTAEVAAPGQCQQGRK